MRDGGTQTSLPDQSPDPVTLRVATILYQAARRAYDYTPADERPERYDEETAGEDEWP